MDTVTVEELPNRPTESTETTTPLNASATPTAHLALVGQFNIDHPTKEEEKKLAELWEYGKKMSKTGDITDIIWEVMHLRSTLGAPRLGESPLDKVYRWAKLRRQQEQIDAELREF